MGRRAAPPGGRRPATLPPRARMRGNGPAASYHALARCCGGLLLAALPAANASAQLLDRYFPANVPAYQDWLATLDTTGAGDAYQPLGLRPGSFTLHATADEAIGYNTNPAGTAAARGSSVLQSDGMVSLDSDWSRDALDAVVTVGDRRFFDQPRQNTTSWTASAGSTIDYGDDQIQLGYEHSNSVTLPTDIGNFGLTAPLVDTVDDLRVSDTIGTGKITIVPALVGQLYRFSAGAGNATPLDLSDRDRLTGSLTAGYQFAGGHNLLVILSDTGVNYSGNGNLRPPDYNDFSVLFGIEYKQSALLAYRALVGYEQRFLSASGRRGGTVTAPGAELDVIWSPTALIALTGRLSESLQDEPTASGQGVTETAAQLVLDYAFRRNVMLEATAKYGRTSFPQSSEVQASYTAGASARWSLTRNWSLALSDDFTRSDSSGNSAGGFTENEVLLQAKFEL